MSPKSKKKAKEKTNSNSNNQKTPKAKHKLDHFKDADEPDFKGLYKKNNRRDIFEINNKKEFKYQFTQDIVFGFGIMIENPIKKIKKCDSNNEKNNDYDEMANRKNDSIKSSEINSEEKEFIKKFVESINQIIITGYQTQTGISRDCWSCNKFIYDLLIMRDAIKKVGTKFFIGVSKIFFSPDYPIVPYITTQTFHFYIHFKQNVNCEIVISGVNIYNGNSTENCPESKHNSQIMFVAELERMPLNNWCIIYHQQITTYVSFTMEKGRCKEFEIPNVFYPAKQSAAIQTFTRNSNTEKWTNSVMDVASLDVYDGLTKKTINLSNYQNFNSCFWNSENINNNRKLQIISYFTELFGIQINEIIKDIIDFCYEKDKTAKMLIEQNSKEKPIVGDTVEHKITVKYSNPSNEHLVDVLIITNSILSYVPHVEQKFRINHTFYDPEPYHEPTELSKQVGEANIDRAIQTGCSMDWGYYYDFYSEKTECVLIINPQ